MIYNLSKKMLNRMLINSPIIQILIGMHRNFLTIPLTLIFILCTSFKINCFDFILSISSLYFTELQLDCHTIEFIQQSDIFEDLNQVVFGCFLNDIAVNGQNYLKLIWQSIRKGRNLTQVLMKNRISFLIKRHQILQDMTFGSKYLGARISQIILIREPLNHMYGSFGRSLQIEILQKLLILNNNGYELLLLRNLSNILMKQLRILVIKVIVIPLIIKHYHRIIPREFLEQLRQPIITLVPDHRNIPKILHELPLEYPRKLKLPERLLIPILRQYKRLILQLNPILPLKIPKLLRCIQLQIEHPEIPHIGLALPPDAPEYLNQLLVVLLQIGGVLVETDDHVLVRSQLLEALICEELGLVEQR